MATRDAVLARYQKLLLRHKQIEANMKAGWCESCSVFVLLGCCVVCVVHHI